MNSTSLNTFMESVLVPLVIIFVGSSGKKLVRGKKGWLKQDFFFGIELSLSAMSGVLTVLFDSSIDSATVQKAAMFIPTCFGLFIYVLSLYQEYQESTPKKQLLWLTFFSIMIGI